MDGFEIALGVAATLLGAYGLYFAATKRESLGNPITRFLFSIKGREPERAYTALSSGALVAFGAYVFLSGMRPALPWWPSLVAIATFAALQISARLSRSDV